MIECKICYKKFKRITYLHLKLHNINYNQYKYMYPNSELISEESRLLTSISAIGNKSRSNQKASDVTKRKQSECNSGEKNPFYKKHHSEETKQKIRQSRDGKYYGKDNPFYGKHHSEQTIEKLSKPKSEEHKQKMRENHADYSGKNNPRYGKTPSILCGIGKRSYYNSPLQGEICLRSSYELAYAKYLDSKNIKWYYELFRFKLSEDTTYTPDFYLPKTKQFIEIKGYMHLKSQIKINKFLEQYKLNFEILYKQDLIKLGIKIK